MTSSLNPSQYGKGITFTATTSSSPGASISGTVTFKDGTNTLGTAGINTSTRKAAFSTAALTGGGHTITAVYSGSGDNAGSTSAVLNETVNKVPSTTTFISNLNPAPHGRTVTLTATVFPSAGIASGSVTFMDGATPLGTGTVNTTSNKAQIKTSSLAVGTHSITARYGGNTNVSASTSAVIKEIIN